jgi:hypothetical protein
MRKDQIEDLIRRHDERGLVDAGWVLAIGRTCGVSEASVEQARTSLGYVRTMRTVWGLRWATAEQPCEGDSE